MNEMTSRDAELVYRHLNEQVRCDIITQSHQIALKNFGKTDILHSANDDPKSDFLWGKIKYEFELHYPNDELVPIINVKISDEPEVYKTAADFGWLVIDNIRKQIKNMQERTIFTPDEFVTLVLDSKMDEPEIATRMRSSVVDVQRRKRRINEKIKIAENTIETAEKIRDSETYGEANEGP